MKLRLTFLALSLLAFGAMAADPHLRKPARSRPRIYPEAQPSTTNVEPPPFLFAPDVRGASFDGRHWAVTLKDGTAASYSLLLPGSPNMSGRGQSYVQEPGGTGWASATQSWRQAPDGWTGAWRVQLDKYGATVTYPGAVSRHFLRRGNSWSL